VGNTKANRIAARTEIAHTTYAETGTTLFDIES
jgi:hypothetical protein